MVKLDEPKTVCRTPNRSGTTRMPSWKFDVIHASILNALNDGPVAWRDLTDMVRSHLTDDQLARMGSVGWHTIGIKLEMEVRGEIRRLPDQKPQMIVRCLANPDS